MKTLTILKLTTAILTTLILAGLVLVAAKISETAQKRKLAIPPTTTVSLPFPEDITDTVPCGKALCLLTAGHPDGRRLIIVEPDTGTVSAILRFSDTTTAD